MLISKIMTAAVTTLALMAVYNQASASTVNLSFAYAGDPEKGWAFEPHDDAGIVYAFPAGYPGLTDDQYVLFQNQGSLVHMLATVIGETYTLSFDASVYEPQDEPMLLTAGLDLGTPQADPLISLTSGSETPVGEKTLNFTQYTATFTATEAMTDIVFALNGNRGSNWMLTDVSVTSNDIAATPLPGASVLFGSGIGLIGCIARYKKRAGFVRFAAA